MFNKTHYSLKYLSQFCLIFVLLFSCKSELKPIEFVVKELKESYKADISVAYDMAKGNNELSRIINENIEGAIIKNTRIDSSNKDLLSVLKSFNNEYVSFKNDYPDASEPKWELHIESELVYQSEEVITVVISTYEYKGGAHGNDYIQLLNLEAGTGRVLKIEDFINNIDGFTSLAKNHFIKNLSNSEEIESLEDYFFGKSFHLPENIGFSDEGLILLYNVYEIASYAQGYTEFAIPYNEVDEFLKLN